MRRAAPEPQLLLPLPSRTGPPGPVPGGRAERGAIREAVVARDGLVRTLAADLRAGRSVMLEGPEGSGKTFLLQELEHELTISGISCAYAATGSSFKPLVIRMAEALHGLGRLSIDGIDVDGDWDGVAGRLARPAVDKITPSVVASLVASDLVLLLDDFDKPWPRYAAYLKQVFEGTTTVVACTSAHTPRLEPYRRYFGRVLQVPPLTRKEARSLAEQLYEACEVNSPDPQAFLRKAVVLADGSPLALRQILQDAGCEKVVTPEYTQRLEREGPKRFVNMGWLLLVLLSLLVAGRYVALGAGDRDMYVIAGILASLGLVFRVFVFRGMRR